MSTGTVGGRRSTSLHVPPTRFVAALLTGMVLSLAVACGSDDAATSDLSSSAQDGRRLYTSRGCGGCHGADGAGGIGPELVGIAGSERELEDGSVEVADEEYIRRSITEPDADRVAGYSIRMPANQLDDSDVDALVAYLLELEPTS